MNATTAALCKKPLIGAAAWLLSLCAANQALKDAYVDLGVRGEVLRAQVVVPMSEPYNLFLWRRPAVTGARPASGGEFACAAGKSLVSLTVEILSTDGRVIESKQFNAHCPRPLNSDPSLVGLGQMNLQEGKFTLRLVNNEPVSIGGGWRMQAVLTGIGEVANGT
jgi:hypothetical protein